MTTTQQAEVPAPRMVPSTTAQGGRTQPTAAVSISPTQFGLEQIALDEGVCFFSSDHALAMGLRGLPLVAAFVRYEPATGVFTWARSISRHQVIGAEAGIVGTLGYVQITLNKQQVLAHRLAWYMTHGVAPSERIDHINGDRTDNRIANLRDASPSVNNQNIYEPQRTNKLGFRGVWRIKGGRERPFVAEISVEGHKYKLGYFATAEEASEAYLQAKARLHPGASSERAQGALAAYRLGRHA